MKLGRRQFLLGCGTASAAQSQSLRSRLAEEFGRLRIADSHEHFWDEKTRLSDPLDFFTLLNEYVISDLNSAGLTAEQAKIMRDRGASPEGRWRAVEPAWKSARFTGYSRALRMAVREFCKVDDIDLASLPHIEAALRVANRPGVTDRLIRKMNAAFCVQDDSWHVTPERAQSDFYVLTRRVDRFIVPGDAQDVGALEKLTGIAIGSLSALKKAMEKNFEENRKVGMAVLKVGLAYMRELNFREAPEADAARDFEAMLKHGNPLPEGFRRALERPFRNMEDHMFHHAMRLAEAHGVPVQIHTGILAGNRAVIYNARPAPLANVFLLYPRIRFDLFHMSYPFENEFLALGKSFPNVHLDFCWGHVISPSTARRTLVQALDSVPANKIFAYGGDYHYPEMSWAHSMIARRNVAEALSDVVEQGGCTETEAVALGRMVLYEGAAAFFGRS